MITYLINKKNTMENNNVSNGMMMESSGPLILGLHMDTFLMLSSGIFYLLCAFLVYKKYKKNPTELVGALLAFLIYQSISMFFMGLEFSTMNILYSNIGSLAVLVGSAYMLKFPFSSFSKVTRKITFYITLVLVFLVFTWFMQDSTKQMELMKFTLYYDIVINGIIVGGSILLLAIRTSEKWLKIKAFGGSTGIISCCIAANGAMLGGDLLTSAFFGFIAPIFILSSLFITKGE